MTILSPIQNERNNYMRKYTRFRVTGNGEKFYILKGHPIPEKEFLALFPVADKVMVRHESQMKGDGIGSAGI